ncbi:hypothetical protein GQ44DRAFT_777648 [Phaeosphaeriaceae sp. PMI808]|nr:hypothetical protein GQ44DRAFT_777648 [Phaeosphaeriaceae sp. PMI808]
MSAIKLTWTPDHEYGKNKDGTVKDISKHDIENVFYFALPNGLKATQEDSSTWIVSFLGETAKYAELVIKGSRVGRPWWPNFISHNCSVIGISTVALPYIGTWRDPRSKEKGSTFQQDMSLYNAFALNPPAACEAQSTMDGYQEPHQFDALELRVAELERNIEAVKIAIREIETNINIGLRPRTILQEDPVLGPVDNDSQPSKYFKPQILEEHRHNVSPQSCATDFEYSRWVTGFSD